MSERKSPKLSDRAATVGRILIYTFTGEEHAHMCGRAICSERPAIVVREPLDSDGAYNVQVFTDCANDVEGGGPGADGTLWLQGLRIAAEPTPGYLHWPEVTAPPKATKALPPPVVPGDVVTVPGEGDLKVTDVAADGSMTAEPAPKPAKAPKAKKSKRSA